MPVDTQHEELFAQLTTYGWFNYLINICTIIYVICLLSRQDSLKGKIEGFYQFEKVGFKPFDIIKTTY